MSEARDLVGRSFLVTGSSAGIGRVTAETLGRRGATVFLANRSEAKTAPVRDAILTAGGDATFLPLDLSDLASVRRCAADFLSRDVPLHVLVNNAGVAGVRGVTRDGFQLTFATNHLGPFLLTLLLLPKLREAPGARVVNVASRAHARTRGIDFDALRRKESLTGFPEYAVSKLCNVLFSAELARAKAGPNVHSYALHPGVIASEVWREVPWPIRPLMMLTMKTPEQGAVASLRCATSPDVAAENGLYYDEDGAAREPARRAKDVALAEELWARSVAWTDAPAV
jgi:NAD(P)-dependent dehydrogenase (short-subunit alcohol dehydrogenase family)